MHARPPTPWAHIGTVVDRREATCRAEGHSLEFRFGEAQVQLGAADNLNGLAEPTELGLSQADP
jgi:hypothetical protein